MSRKDMPDWQRCKSFRQMKSELKNNMIEDSFNIENQVSKNVQHIKKLLVESYQNNI